MWTDRRKSSHRAVLIVSSRRGSLNSLAALFLVAAYIIGFLATNFEPVERTPGMGFLAATREGFQILRTNRRAYLSIVYLVTAIALSRVLIILLPKYTREALHIAPEDTVFVAAPAARGAALGLVFVPIGARLFGAWRVVIFGFLVPVLGMAGLGLVVLVRDTIVQNFDFGVGFLERKVGVSSAITMAMLSPSRSARLLLVALERESS